MTFRIIRGALLGTVLGLIIGVSLSGAMYMFNYMKQGAKLNKEQSLVADSSLEDTKEEVDQETQQIVLDMEKLQESFDYESYKTILDSEGIAGVARNMVASYGSIQEPSQDQTVATVATSGQITTAEEVVITSGQVYKELSDGEEQQGYVTPAEGTETSDYGDTLGDSLLRFHVRAHSDSQVDIELKYKVRDKVLESIEENMNQCQTKEEAVEYIIDNLDYIEEISVEALREAGFGYPVEAYITKDYFPIRQYGDMVLPAGYYDALRIDIGMAEGENFWCLLYPTMCIPREAGAIITEDGKEELRSELSDEEYEKLFVERQVPEEDVEIRFKFIEWLFQ